MSEILVVGGGAIGMLTALELCAAGRNVVLVERGDTGRESSWAGGGIISPLFPWRYLDPVTALASWSQAHYPALCAELTTETGVDPEFTRSGLLLIAPDEREAALSWAAEHDRRVEVVSPDRFRTLEPTAADAPDQALWMPEVGQVRNPRMVRALRSRLIQRGVPVKTGVDVEGIAVNAGRCTGVNTSSGSIDADQVVVCAGAWSRELLRELPDTPDVRPIRGQMLLFQAPPGTITRMVLEGTRYVIPRRDGSTLFGSTLEDVGFEKATTEEARTELQALATRRFPVLADYPVVAHWAGLRPAAPAGIPYIGPHPSIAGLHINAGHYRNGLVLGPASARLAADLILGREPIVDPAPYGWTAGRG